MADFVGRVSTRLGVVCPGIAEWRWCGKPIPQPMTLVNDAPLQPRFRGNEEALDSGSASSSITVSRTGVSSEG